MTQAPEKLSERALRHRAEQLASLLQIDAFQALIRSANEKADRMRNALFSQVMLGVSLESNQRQIDYDRGFIDGMKYISERVPAAALSKLERNEFGEEPETENTEDRWSYGR